MIFKRVPRKLKKAIKKNIIQYHVKWDYLCEESYRQFIQDNFIMNTKEYADGFNKMNIRKIVNFLNA